MQKFFKFWSSPRPLLFNYFHLIPHRLVRFHRPDIDFQISIIWKCLLISSSSLERHACLQQGLEDNSERLKVEVLNVKYRCVYRDAVKHRSKFTIPKYHRHTNIAEGYRLMKYDNKNEQEPINLVVDNVLAKQIRNYFKRMVPLFVYQHSFLVSWYS